MRDVVSWHSKNRELGDASLLALDHTCPLVQHRQIGVHVSGVPTPSGDFLTGSPNLTQGFAVVGHVSVDNKHVVIVLERQVLGSRQGQSRSDQALDGGVVR